MFLRAFIAALLTVSLFPVQAVSAAPIGDDNSGAAATNTESENFTDLQEAQEAGFAGVLPEDETTYQSDELLVV